MSGYSQYGGLVILGLTLLSALLLFLFVYFYDEIRDWFR